MRGSSLFATRRKDAPPPVRLLSSPKAAAAEHIPHSSRRNWPRLRALPPINRHYGKTYYFSSCLFPAHLRPAVHALYAWVRYPDEWVDNPGDLSIAEQRDKLGEWRDATADAIKTGHSDHPVLAAFADAARRHEVSLAHMRDFLEAMERDLVVSTYETFDDLQRYTWGSASVVGLMMCAILGATDKRAVPYATDLGLAMQLTNFLRDVGEDWRERGRIYLPLEDLRRFGVSQGDIAKGRLTDNFCALVRFEAERTRAIYARSDAGFGYIPDEGACPCAWPACCTPASWTRSSKTTATSCPAAPACRPGKSWPSSPASAAPQATTANKPRAGADFLPP
jgi:phytoene synthase